MPAVFERERASHELSRSYTRGSGSFCTWHEACSWHVQLKYMLYLILNWSLGTTGLALLAIVLPGFRVDEFQSALIAAAVTALVHAAISTAFRPDPSEGVLTVSGTLLAFADTVVFRVVALLVPGFAMRGFSPALAGGLLLLGLNLLLPRLFRDRHATVEPVMNA